MSEEGATVARGAVEEAAEPPRRTVRATVRGLLRAMRPHQWVKNLFVVAPAVFARRLDEPQVALHAAFAFLCFGFASSAVYLFNDLRDVAADRLHPVKRHRPIAAGVVSEALAARASAALALLAVGGGALLRPAFGGVVLGYLLLNVLYTLWTKRVPYLDVLSIALGFELRVVGGAVAASVPPSGYLLLVTFLLAAFLGFGKRLHELGQLQRRDGQRAVLRAYSRSWLERLLWITSVATVLTYLVYTLDPHTARVLGTDRLWWTVPMAAFGILRFVGLLRRRDRAESPTEAMLRDAPFVANLLLWVVVVLALLYSGLASAAP